MSLATDAGRTRARALRVLRRPPPTDFERAPIKADINVTPLVDVVLVLLIIFMVVTPLIASGVAVDLPRTTHHSRKPDDGKDIIVSVTREGQVFVGTRALAKLADLGSVISAEQRKFPDKSVFLKADARARFGAVREAMHVLHEASIADIVLGTEELTQESRK